MTTSADALAFACIIILSIFLLILFIDKELLWNVIRKRMPLGPMIKGILFLLSPILIVLLSGRLTKQKIKTIRKVILLKSRFRRVYSVLYIGFFIILFFASIIISIITRTPG